MYDPQEIEKRVVHRELYLVPWEWMEQFPPSDPTAWGHVYRYPKAALLPPIVERKKAHGGHLYFTEGVDPSVFQKRKRSWRRFAVPF